MGWVINPPVIRRGGQREPEKKVHVRTESEMGGRQPQALMPGAPGNWERQEGTSPGVCRRNMALTHPDFGFWPPDL